MATILLTKLKCIRPSDGGGADDVRTLDAFLDR